MIGGYPHFRKPPSNVEIYLGYISWNISAIVKVPEQVGVAKSALRKGPRFQRTPFERFPKTSSQARFPGRGSQARFPHNRFPSKIP